MKRIIQILVIATFLCFPFGKGVASDQLELAQDEVVFVFFSLPDGEAMLIQTGTGEAYLVNTGSVVSETMLIEQMNQLGIRQLDGLIFTNQNHTTCGNVERLVKRYHVEALYFAHSLSSLCSKGIGNIKQHRWSEGEVHTLPNGLTIRVLPAQIPSDMSLYFMYGKTSILYLASGELTVEEKLIKLNPLKAEIIKVGDYATTQSPSSALLEKVDPHIALIYPLKGAHPNQTLLERLNESWIEVYQLKKVGTTTIHCTLDDYDLHPDN